MRKKMTKKKKRILLIVAAVIVFLIIIASLADDEEEQSASLRSSQRSLTRPDYDTQSYEGELAWAIYWYLCGSDLETEYQAASEDLEELLSVKLPGNVKVIIQTGGSRRWHSNNIRSNELGRYVYDNTGFHKIEGRPNASMGNGNTLREFLNFCLTNYPAQRQALVFWNHGGGTFGGVCHDEIYDDSLSLADISLALNQFQAGYQEPRFELIGFDACLMATVDAAYSLAGYANYMVASQELVPGIGWDYIGIAQALADNSAMDGAALGRIICDTYQADCIQQDVADDITMSVVDLNRASAFFTAYDNFGLELLTRSVEHESFFSNFSRIARNLESYGGNSRSEGFTNMVDMGHMAREGQRSLSLTTSRQLLNTLENCVIYSVAGPLRRESSGLAAYYPLDNNQINLSIFRGLGTSGHFLSYYEYVLTGTLPQSARSSLLAANISASTLASAPEVPSINFMDLEDYPVELNEDGYAIMNLGPQVANLLSAVYNWLAYLDTESEHLIILGRDANVNADWDNGIFIDNFYGKWMMLDGHLVFMELTFTGDDYILYHIPVLLNGRQFHLHASYSYDTELYTIHGARRGLESSGMGSRQLRKLRAGDSITSLFYMFFDMDDLDEEAELHEYETFTIGDNPVLDDFLLPDGTYIYMFEMEDAQGESVLSEAVIYYMEDGKLYFDSE